MRKISSYKILLNENEDKIYDRNKEMVNVDGNKMGR